MVLMITKLHSYYFLHLKFMHLFEPPYPLISAANLALVGWTSPIQILRNTEPAASSWKLSRRWALSFQAELWEV